MKILFLILGLIVISHQQEKVLENWVSSSNAGFSKYFVKPNYNWSQTKEFAVYGWFKINPSVALTKQSVLFHLTSNVSGDSSFNKKIGDFVFGILYQDKKLSIGTYSAPGIPYYSVNVNVRTQDLGKWTFFYVAYSGTKNKLFYRFEFNNVYFKWGSISGLKHNLSTYYKLFVGSQLKFSKFPGQISKVHIRAGSGSYRESGFSQIIPFNEYTLPSQNCPIAFEECNYRGKYYKLCSSSDNPPTSVTIKSVYVPAGWFVGISDTLRGVQAMDQSMPCGEIPPGDTRRFNAYLPSINCPTAFEECEYKGKQYKLCSSSDNVPTSVTIKSFYVPYGWFVGISDTLRGAYSMDQSISCGEIPPGDTRRFEVSLSNVNCPTAFEECEYKGQSYKLCTSADNVPTSVTIKSVYVPYGWFVGFSDTLRGAFAMDQSMSCGEIPPGDTRRFDVSLPNINCPTAFEECEFRGQQYKLCGSADNVPTSVTIKSVYVPYGWFVGYSDTLRGAFAMDQSMSCGEIPPGDTRRFDVSLTSINCPTAFEECEYKGNRYELCSGDDNPPTSVTIKSVYVPYGWLVQISDTLRGVQFMDINMSCGEIYPGDTRRFHVSKEQ